MLIKPDVWQDFAFASGKIPLLYLVLVPLQPHGNCCQEAEMQANSHTPVLSEGCLPCFVLVRDTLEA